MSVVYSGFNPDVVNPRVRSQTASQQIPFFFGGSQIPFNLGMPKGSFSGTGFVGAFLGKDGKVHTPSKTHRGDFDFTTKRGDKVYHKGGKDIKMFGRPFVKKLY